MIESLLMLRSSSNFTSESVSEGHPDKVCDKISDAVLDHCLNQNPEARVACEVAATKDNVFVMGELKGAVLSDSEIENLTRALLKDIGYESQGFHHETVKVHSLLHEQSKNISQGVDKSEGVLGAGDQGLVFGYASNETKALMPSAVYYAHRLTEMVDSLRKTQSVDWLLPDAKSQVTVAYEKGAVSCIPTLVVSTCHKPHVGLGDLREFLKEKIIALLGSQIDLSGTEFKINVAGEFTTGGPVADTGLTGRKIVVDTYGGSVPNGGGAFSGKDASKVDRSGAYFARYLAKNIVGAQASDRCLVQISYAIGEPLPVDISLELYNVDGKERIDASKLENFIKENFSWPLKKVIQHLGLYEPIYQQTTNYGHMGKDWPSWEQLDLVEDIKNLL